MSGPFSLSLSPERSQIRSTFVVLLLLLPLSFFCFADHKQFSPRERERGKRKDLWLRPPHWSRSVTARQLWPASRYRLVMVVVSGRGESTPQTGQGLLVVERISAPPLHHTTAPARAEEEQVAHKERATESAHTLAQPLLLGSGHRLMFVTGEPSASWFCFVWSSTQPAINKNGRQNDLSKHWFERFHFSLIRLFFLCAPL